MRVVSITNFKGGVGKTSVCTMVAQDLAYRGFRVLILDADPQGHATVLLREDRNAEEVVRALTTGGDLASKALLTRMGGTKSYVVPGGTQTALVNRNLVMQKSGGAIYEKWMEELAHELPSRLDSKALLKRLEEEGCAPEQATKALGVVADWLRNQMNVTLHRLFSQDFYFGREVGLSAFLADPTIEERFDICLVDTPPTMTDLIGDLAMNSDYYLIIARAEGFSRHSLSQISSHINGILTDRGVPDHLKANYVGILVNLFRDVKLQRALVQELEDAFHAMLFQTRLPADPHVERATGAEVPYVPNRNNAKKAVSRAVHSACDELLGRLGLPMENHHG